MKVPVTAACDLPSGVECGPQEPQIEVRHLESGLAEAGVRGVALTFVDTAGITRVKTVPLGRLGRAATGASVCRRCSTRSSPTTASRPPTGSAGRTGTCGWCRTWTGVMPLVGQPGWAWAPVDRYTQDGTPYPACQRLFAARMVAAAAGPG